jgi:hypothetical protein
MVLGLLGMAIAQALFVQNLKASLAPAVTVTSSPKHGIESETKDLHPFTHVASIPASSDPATIQFERLKARPRKGNNK